MCVTYKSERIYEELQTEYPDIMDIDNPFASILGQVYQKSGTAFVIIIDEWDCVIRNFPDKPYLVYEYLKFLHSLLKVKNQRNSSRLDI